MKFILTKEKAEDLKEQLELTGGGGSSETSESIKSKYESNPDTNAFTDSLMSKLESLPTEGAKGDKGDKGDDGAQGIQGEKGEAFVYADFTAPQLLELKGEKGDKGDIGLTGDKGDTGSQGVQGDKGDKGDIGEKGDTGEKGDKGDAFTYKTNDDQADTTIMRGTTYESVTFVCEIESNDSNINSPSGGEFYGIIKWEGLGSEDVGMQIAEGTYPRISKKRYYGNGEFSPWVDLYPTAPVTP